MNDQRRTGDEPANGRGHSRRTFLFGALAAGLGAAAAGCGGSGPNPPSSAPAPAAPSPVAPQAAPAASPANAAAPAAGSGETPRRGGTLVIADPQGGNTLDPFKTSWHSTAHFFIYDRVLVQNLDKSYIGQVARDWTAAEDGKSLTFRLRNDVKFTDGTPLDAAALKWAFEHYVDKSVAAPGASAFGPLTGIDVIEPYVARFNYASPFAPLFNGLSGREIVSPTAYQKLGDDFAQSPVGSGPYKLKEIIPGNQIAYVRNEEFKWPAPYAKNQGPPYPDGAVIKILTEEATIWAALLSGEVHIGGVPTVNIEEAQKNPNLAVHRQINNGIRYLGMNTTYPGLDNPKIRRAISHAIDREAIVKNAWDGHAEVVYGPLAVPIAGYYPEIKEKAYTYNPEQAKQLLAEEGYTTSGGMAQKDGKPLEFELMASNDDWEKRTAQIIQNQLKAVGIGIQIKVMEGTARTQATTTGKHQLFVLFYGSTEPDILYYFFHSSNKGGTNRAWYSTDEIDRLLEQGRTTLDQEKRFGIYKQIQELIVQAAPWVPIGNPYNYYGVRKEVQGFQLHPAGGFLLQDVWLKT